MLDLNSDPDNYWVGLSKLLSPTDPLGLVFKCLFFPSLRFATSVASVGNVPILDICSSLYERINDTSHLSKITQEVEIAIGRLSIEEDIPV